MQTWEYTTVHRLRVWEPPTDEPWVVAGSWYVEGSEADIDAVLSQMGEQGWELVSISPRSSYAGGVVRHANPVNTGTGSVLVEDRDYAGLTTEELWVFKRPKE